MPLFKFVGAALVVGIANRVKDTNVVAVLTITFKDAAQQNNGNDYLAPWLC